MDTYLGLGLRKGERFRHYKSSQEEAAGGHNNQGEEAHYCL